MSIRKIEELLDRGGCPRNCLPVRENKNGKMAKRPRGFNRKAARHTKRGGLSLKDRMGGLAVPE